MVFITSVGVRAAGVDSGRYSCSPDNGRHTANINVHVLRGNKTNYKQLWVSKLPKLDCISNIEGMCIVQYVNKIDYFYFKLLFDY